MGHPTKTTEGPLEAAKRKATERSNENVSAAIDQLESGPPAALKAAATVKRRLEELDDLVAALQARITELERDLEDRHEKLRKVQGILA